MIKDEINNYEKENEKLLFFLQKQRKRIEKLRKKCSNGEKQEGEEKNDEEVTKKD